MDKQKLQAIRELRPIDDVFFEVLAKDKGVCEEIIRTILDDYRLTVLQVNVQESLKNLYGRSVRLDALCILGNGTRCNIEVQKSDNDNHLKRVRYNASCITASVMEAGSRFENVPDLYMIYISEFDVFRQGKAAYHIDKVIRETQSLVDDGLHEIFVNAAIDDGSKVAELMQCFTDKEVNNPKFPNMSARVWEIKETEGGRAHMCEVMERLMAESIQKSRAEGKIEGKIEGRMEGQKETLVRLICRKMVKGKSVQVIAEELEEDIETVQHIYEVASRYAPDYDIEGIVSAL